MNDDSRNEKDYVYEPPQGWSLTLSGLAGRGLVRRARITGAAKVRMFEICGLPFLGLSDLAAPDALIAIAGAAGAERRGRHVHLVNAYTVSLAAEREDLRCALTDESALNLMDGTPLAWLARGRGLVGRNFRAARGPSLFRATLEAGAACGTKHFFLGGDRRTLTGLLAAVEALELPIVVAGSYGPPFRDLTSDERREMVDMIRYADPDIVWVGLGTPKQDLEGAWLATEVPTLTVAVGAAFNFVAGTKPEAPRFLRGSGLEWIYRLVCEPRRLWRRYMFGNLQFLGLILSSRKRDLSRNLAG